MSNWKIGQKLVCIDDSHFTDKSNAPQEGDIVTFDGYAQGIDLGGIYLVGYTKIFRSNRVAYLPKRFRPLQGEPAKAELLSSFREVVESADCPINVPQTETA